MNICPDTAITYLDFVWERHHIWEQRQAGIDAPWTQDRVLAGRKFTNVFRVLDPGSQFVFDLDDDSPMNTLGRLFLYRFTNLPETWEFVRSRLGHYPVATDILPSLADLINEIPGKKFSGAYMILPQPGQPGNKIEQVVALTREFLFKGAPAFLRATTQEERFESISNIWGAGDFYAMQILTDWGYTRHALGDFENDFVTPGPGCRMGAAALLGHDIAADKKWVSNDEALEVIDWCQRAVHSLEYPPSVVCGPAHRRLRFPSKMDIQNTLCEFSKYARLLAKPPKGHFRPAHASHQPPPRLPAHW
jgi:hypothetical protein